MKLWSWIKTSGIPFAFIILLSGFNTTLQSQEPIVTVRFANQSFNCASEYCVDVEFKSNTPNVRIFGVNVRFFYPDSLLELIGFSDFQGGYLPVAPDPPIVLTSAFAGPALFNFNGPADFVNGSIQLINFGIVTYLDTVNWTKLFQVCFHVDDPNPNLQSFCPSLVWDLEQFPTNQSFRHGYLSGDDGVVITLVDPIVNSETTTSEEDVVQFNWMYSGGGTPPYGMPVPTNCTTLTPDCSPTITCPSGRTLECGESTDPINTGYATSTDICDGEPVITYTDTVISGSCPQQYSILRKWISSNACNFSDTCIQTLMIVDTVPPIITCTPDITVLCPNVPVFLTPIATDLCDPSVVVTFSDITIAGMCPAQYVINRTWRATDDCGNSSTCLVTATIKDEVIPSIACPANVTVDCQEDNSSTHTGSATASDNCSSISITQSQTSTQNPDIDACGHYTYEISRQWTATDACGNSSTCVQTINVRDITSPVVTCPADITILFPASTMPVNTGNATALDNCDSGLSMSFTDVLSPNICSSISKITRTWVATDACGNSGTCQQTIVVDDWGSICGSVHDDLGQPIPGVEIRLIADVNNNQDFDAGDTLVATLFSNSITGLFCFQQIRPCNYLLVEIQPSSYGEMSDYDSSPDPDGDDSSEGPDNEIPVVLSPGESDIDNEFIDIICPTVLPVITPDTICANGSVVFQISALPLGTLSYSWDFGSGSSPGTGTGLGPHTVSYVTTTNNQLNGAVISMDIGKVGCANLVGQVSSVEINPYPNALINGSTSTMCYYTNRTFQPVAPAIPGATYQWTFGSSAVPLTATGYGPHTVYYTTAGSKTVKLVIRPNEPGAQCPDSSSISFNVITCVANITGSVKNTSGIGIGSVNVKLFTDNDTNGIADNATAVKNVFTGTDGIYSMATITPGNYVIVQSQPTGWVSFDDEDITPDGDIVPNIDSLDNIIPATLYPATVDNGNNFTESPAPGEISGYVFVDTDDNGIPGVNEGIAGVTIKLFSDNNQDGQADNNMPLATQITSSMGLYSFPLVPIGNYVIVETQSAGYTSVIDMDNTEDLDIPTNTNLHNDTIPVTILLAEIDDSNFFIEGLPCNLLVTNTLDSGSGSLRDAIACAQDGDTIRFANALSGMTINITSTRIEISKELTILSTLAPRLTISSQLPGLFKILNEVEFHQIDIITGLAIAGNMGAAFENLGDLKLYDVHILRNSGLAPGQYLIRNFTNSHLRLNGTCLIEMD